MIQYICFDPLAIDQTIRINQKVNVNDFSRPISFDQYKINIIDLNNELIWVNNESSENNTCDCINNIDSIGRYINNSQRSNIIVLLPQNLKFKSKMYGKDKICLLKDMLPILTKYFIFALMPEHITFEIEYEASDTLIEKQEFESDFYFSTYYCDEKHISKGNNCTTIQNERLFLTTLQIENYEDIELIIRDLGLVVEKRCIPEWMEDINMFDDDLQNENILLFNQKIKEIEEKKKEAEKVLTQNNRYKSILYTNGNELVEVVFEILEELLACDLSGFKDEKNEDFVIEFSDKIFIGEIKGVTSNIKSEHVSQLEVHYQTYIEEKPVDEEIVKALLIMNPLRNKPVDQRDSVHEKQIALAKRNGSLIIDTYTLLKVFEKYKNEELKSDECKKLLFESTGLLEI